MKRLRIVLASTVAVGLIWGCQPPAADPPKAVTLKQGTTVKLLLVNKLQSGRTEKGTPATFVVAEDVTADGTVVIPKGSVAVGSVIYSRREDGLDALTNTPARLNVDLGAISISGSSIDLSADAKEDTVYEFNRANTGRKNRGGDEEQAFADDAKKAVAERVEKLIESGDVQDLDTQALRALASDLGLQDLASAVDKGESERAVDLVKKIRSGSSIAALVSADGGLAFGAAMQLLELGGQVGNRLGRMLSGRNIVAHPGTQVDAYVSESVSVVPVQSK